MEEKSWRELSRANLKGPWEANANDAGEVATGALQRLADAAERQAVALERMANGWDILVEHLKAGN